nr:60S ribosomal protein L8-3-like [Malus domestica]
MMLFFQVNKKAAKSLADPQECPNLFEDWQVSLALEFKDAENRGIYPPVDTYCGKKANLVVGNVLPLRSIPEGAVVCNVKHHVGDRGTLARASGDYAVVINHNPDNDTSRTVAISSMFSISASRDLAGIGTAMKKRGKTLVIIVISNSLRWE